MCSLFNTLYHAMMFCARKYVPWLNNGWETLHESYFQGGFFGIIIIIIILFLLVYSYSLWHQVIISKMMAQILSDIFLSNPELIWFLGHVNPRDVGWIPRSWNKSGPLDYCTASRATVKTEGHRNSAHHLFEHVSSRKYPLTKKQNKNPNHFHSSEETVRLEALKIRNVTVV